MRSLWCLWSPSSWHALLMVSLREWDPEQLLVCWGEVNIYSGFLDLEGEVHSIWDLWTSGLQECKGNLFFWKRVRRVAIFTCDKHQKQNQTKMEGLSRGVGLRGPTMTTLLLKVFYDGVMSQPYGARPVHNFWIINVEKKREGERQACRRTSKSLKNRWL